MYLNNKCVSAVVATALLLVIAVMGVVGFNIWFNSYGTEIIADTEEGSQDLEASDLQGILRDELYFVNEKSGNVTIQSVSIGSKKCNVSNVSVSSGMFNVSLKNCTQNISEGKYEVVVVTDKEVVARFLDVKPTIVCPSQNVSMFFKYLIFSNGTSQNLSWFVNNALSCNASGSWSGSKNVSGGTELISNISSTGSFVLDCGSDCKKTHEVVYVNQSSDYIISVYNPNPSVENYTVKLDLSNYNPTLYTKLFLKDETGNNVSFCYESKPNGCGTTLSKARVDYFRFGTSTDDDVYKLKYNGANLYFVGGTKASDSTHQDGWFGKISPSTGLLWARTMGVTSAYDNFRGLAFDGSNPIVGGPMNGNSRAFLAEFSDTTAACSWQKIDSLPASTTLWKFYSSIAKKSSEFVAAGMTEYSGTAYSTIARFDGSGSYLGTYHIQTCTNSEGLKDVGVDSSGNVYVAGYCPALVKLDSSYNFVWGKTPQTAGTYIEDLVVSGSYVYVSGFGGSPYNSMVWKYDLGGNLIWKTGPSFTSAFAFEYAYGLDVDSLDNVYLVGTSPSVTGGFGGDDAYIIKYNSSGSIVWSFLVGGTGSDLFKDVEVIGDKIYVIGESKSDSSSTDIMMFVFDDENVPSTQVSFSGGNISVKPYTPTFSGAYNLNSQSYTINSVTNSGTVSSFTTTNPSTTLSSAYQEFYSIWFKAPFLRGNDLTFFSIATTAQDLAVPQSSVDSGVVVGTTPTSNVSKNYFFVD